jgi:hypothetical protein
MKNKLLITLVVVILAVGIVAAYGTNLTFARANNISSTIHVTLISATYSNDHVAIEYSVDGQITTPDGVVTECPVGGASILDNSGREFSGSAADFIDCRPDGVNRYLVTQFFYNDYSGNKNPKHVKIKIGDVNFMSATGKVVHVLPLNDFSVDLPAQPDPASVAYPTETSQAASGLKMRVSRVDFSASLAKVDACITLPDNGDWVFDAYLVIGGQKMPFDYWSIPNYKTPGTLDSRERCYSIITSHIPDYRTIQKGQMSLVVEKVSRNMPECVDAAGFSKIQDELAKYGVKPQPDQGGNYCFASGIQSIADPNVNAYLNSYIRDALREEVIGPLEITLK